MKNRRSLAYRSWTVGMAVVFLVSACQSPPPPVRVMATASQNTRNNSYSLLHQVLEQEKDVSMLRFIKHENQGLKDLIKEVARAAKNGADHLEEFAKQDSSLALDHYDLPPGEKETRASISSRDEKDLLHDSGGKFELILILTQIDALNYASHLAKVAAHNDSRPERIQYLLNLSDEMKNFHDQLVAQISLR